MKNKDWWRNVGIIIAVLILIPLFAGCVEKGTETGENVTPSVTIDANVTSGDAPLSVNFTANATDPDGYVANYTWNFGDGNTSYQQNPVHVFIEPNAYNVTLTVRDNNGSVATYSMWITAIEVGPENELPTVTITHPSSGTTISGTITIQGTASDSDGEVQTVQVKIDDNAWKTASGTTSWSYGWDTTEVSDGAHSVYARSHDGRNYSSIIYSVGITVDNPVPNQRPVADASNTHPIQANTEQQITFDGSASYDPDGIIVLYEWDWTDDGTYDWSGSSATTTHSYSSNGTYTAKLRVTDNDGGSATDSVQIEVTSIEEVPLVLKIWAAENYGDGNCITEETGDNIGVACMTDNLAPLPESYTKDDVCNEKFLMWCYENVGWCIPHAKTAFKAAMLLSATSQTICDWIDEVGVNNLTEDHARYIYAVSQGWNAIAQMKYNELSPQPSEIDPTLATRDNALGVYYYSHGWYSLGNNKTGCNYNPGTTICDWINEIGINNLTVGHAIYVWCVYNEFTNLTPLIYGDLNPQPSEIDSSLATKDNACGIYYYYKGWLNLGNMKTGCNYQYNKNLTVYFIDVGQGDSIFIETPNEKHILIDAGDTYHGDDVVAFLENLSVTTIDVLVATHPDADHIGGLDEVIYAFNVLSVYHPGLVRETDNYTNFIIAAENEGCPIYTDDEVDPGDYINISSTTTFQILHINKYASDSNDASIVIKTSYGSVDFLFTGDISSSVESELINSPFDLDSDILKVAHHGSKYSTYDAFLDVTTPSVGIISVGSSYGHPTEETLTRLANHKVEVYRTDYNGTVTVTTNGETWSAECERENNPPVAGFTYHTDNITAYFTDISSDPDGDVLTYDWDFGDGNTSEEQNPTHTYSAEGTYNVTLIVSDGKASDSTSKYVTITQQPSTGHIVINEIEQNPYGDDAGNEWVELFNPTDSAIDISGWKLQTTHGNIETHYIPEETTINSGGYLVITFNKQFLDNNGDSVILFDRNSNEIDRTPVVGDSHDDSRSWQRTPNGYDSDSPSDWQFKYATEGYSNS